jgi:hypothetical protein
VVSLDHINLATDKDKQFGIDRWAMLFKSTTQEDIIMLANENNISQDTAEDLLDPIPDETIRAQCRAREDYNRQQSAIKYHIKELTTELKKVTSEKQQLIADAEYYKKLLDEHGISYDAADKNK